MRLAEWLRDGCSSTTRRSRLGRNLASAGRIDEARALGERVQRLADVVFAKPVGDYRVRLKECLRILGVLDSAHVRRPLMPVDDAERAHLADVLAEVGLLEPARARGG